MFEALVDRTPLLRGEAVVGRGVVPKETGINPVARAVGVVRPLRIPGRGNSFRLTSPTSENGNHNNTSAATTVTPWREKISWNGEVDRHTAKHYALFDRVEYAVTREGRNQKEPDRWRRYQLPGLQTEIERGWGDIEIDGIAEEVVEWGWDNPEREHIEAKRPLTYKPFANLYALLESCGIVFPSE